MISWIKGEIVSSWQNNNKYFVLINCQGLGYEIQTLETVYKNINNDSADRNINLWLKHLKKEDSDSLFGFSSKDERDFFVEILNIKGIGAQIGMSLLNKYSLNQIIKAIIENNKNLISSAQGIGQKMTERIILEMRGKLTKKIELLEKNNIDDFLINDKKLNSILEDLELTLHTLNYPKKEVKNLFPILINDIKNKKIKSDSQNSLSFESLLKEAINYLDKNGSNIVI